MNSQQSILLRLKELGPQNTFQIADHLGITNVGARKHLLKLRDAGLVLDFSQAEKAGRPNQYWQLTDEGHAEFPDRHADLSLQLISSVQNIFGDDGLDQLISCREMDNLKNYRAALDGIDELPERVATLTHLRKQEGYMAVHERDEQDPEVYWLHENHCPICDAAKHCLKFCRSELSLFRQALGNAVSVERVDHVLTGARRCSYKIQALA